MSEIKIIIVRDLAFTPPKFAIQISQHPDIINIDVTNNTAKIGYVIDKLLEARKAIEAHKEFPIYDKKH